MGSVKVGSGLDIGHLNQVYAWNALETFFSEEYPSDQMSNVKP